ncbi:MAG: methyltransferase domain-containing protein [Persicimonas sp.]
MAKKAKKSTVDELARVKYVGPAKAKAFVEELGIESVEELYEASKNGKLQSVKGVGDALQKRIHKSAGEVLESKEDEKSAKKKATRQKSKGRKTSKQGKKSKSNGRKKARKTNGRGEAKREAQEAVERARKAAKKAAESAEEKVEQAKKVAGEVGKEAAARLRDKPASAPDRAPDEELVERFVATLRCPACGHDEFERGTTTLTCKACRREYNFHNGVADLAPPKPSGRSITQRVMESRVYARFYEDIMRPRLTGLVSERPLDEEYRLSTDLLELGEDTRLLDVACGTGNFTRYFAQQLEAQGVEDSLVTGMDLSWPMLETARTYLRRDGLDQKIFLIRGDATRIPAKRAAYNRLHCGGALHMMNNADEALRNFARVLSPGGICVVGTFILGDGVLRRLVKRAAEFPTRFHWFSREELHQRMRRAGFEIVEDSVAGDAITVKARRT